ncbi:putative tyrosine/serine protein phosphatase [Aspergillus mulundensis]|uniref:Tyrosine specific protein phosphatases domain-containing protein n=1 Tax=Aspergillus mulundensis TaxID=1810919 RepID=A0A3D8Q6H2_9EURO|nr:Uncharacterized protein DSM5745_11516 [Aspergillus mulundensis]RDW57432.1 Uncharacterized protein DSM5745_11516 [Aspergillus mulundensis]
MSGLNPDRPFDSIVNFRDVGRTINKLAGRKRSLPQCPGMNRLSVSAPCSRWSNSRLQMLIGRHENQLDEASEEDIRRLTSDLRVSTIVDLRSTTEHQMAVKKYKRAHNLPTESVDSQPQTGEGYIHLRPLDSTDIQRHLISLTGKAFERHLLWRLDWWNFTKVLAYIAAGYRHDAVRIVGENVMKPVGLTGLAMTTLEASTAEIKQIFDILASVKADMAANTVTDSSTSATGVLIHCTQGKDRTGLIILLLLLLTDAVDAETMASEYVLSEEELENEPTEEKEERMREIRALGLDEEYARCPKDFTQRVTEFLTKRYGGVRKYSESVGVEEGIIESVKRRFLA